MERSSRGCGRVRKPFGNVPGCGNMEKKSGKKKNSRGGFGLKNNFVDALDKPVGVCLQNGGRNDCRKWPSLVPSPCCWLSCSELCEAACWKADGRYGEKCKHFRKLAGKRAG